MASQSGLTQSVEVSVKTERWILFATVLASSMAFIDGTALNVALPALQADLGASGSELLWILNSYALLVAALLLIGGSLGDRFGRRRISMIGIVIFSGASLACGVAPNVSALITARALQGIGGALMIPGSLAIITATISKERLGKAIGTWSAFSVIATALGPVLGGILADAGLWRCIFFINIPLAVVAVSVLYLKVPETQDTDVPAHIDYWGAILATTGLIGINYGLIEAAAFGFNEPRVLISITGGLATLLLFFIVEARSNSPFLPLQLFKVPTFNAAAILTLSFYSGLYGILFFFSLNLIQVQGYNAALAGLTQLPLMILVVALSRWAGGLVDQYGPRLPLTIGPAIAGFGFLLFALPGLTNGPADFWRCYLPPLVLLGLAMGMTVAPLSTTVMGSVSLNRTGLASGINSALSRLSSVLGIAILGPIALVSFSQSLQSRTAALDLSDEARVAVSEQAANLGDAKVPIGLSVGTSVGVDRALKLAFVDAFRTISYVCAGVVWASTLLAVFIIDGRTPRRLPTHARTVMANFSELKAPCHLEDIPKIELVPAMDADSIARDTPDAHWLLTDCEGAIAGRYSLWWRNTPLHQGHQIGVIGHYAVNDRWAAREVLQHACKQLKANGCTMAVGPMNGNTWRQYRLVTEFGSEPTFFLEPNNPEDWPDHFVENGFEPLAEYFSALDTDLSYKDPRRNSVADRITAAGISIRSLDPQHFEDDLRRIYAVAKVCFRNHILYSEIAEAEFIGEYQVFQHFVRHDLVLIAERHTEPVGFLFAVPDLLQAKRGDTIDTLIVKTLGVLPGRDYAGLGHLLLERVGSTAFQLGYTRLIHALVRDVGTLRKMSCESARPMRRYTLFAKELRS